MKSEKRKLSISYFKCLSCNKKLTLFLPTFIVLLSHTGICLKPVTVGYINSAIWFFRAIPKHIRKSCGQHTKAQDNYSKFTQEKIDFLSPQKSTMQYRCARYCDLKRHFCKLFGVPQIFSSPDIDSIKELVFRSAQHSGLNNQTSLKRIHFRTRKDKALLFFCCQAFIGMYAEYLVFLISISYKSCESMNIQRT